MKLSHRLLYFILGTLILLFPAFLNGFPLMYSDAGTYIFSGFELINPLDRPIFYGVFLRHFSMAESLWFVVIMQSLICFWLIHLLTRSILGNSSKVRLFTLIISACLIISTGIGSYVSQVTPDIFSSFWILSLSILLLNTNLSFLDKFLLWIVFCVSLLFHLSNFISFFIFLIIILTYLFAVRKKGKQFPVNFTLNLLIGLAIFISAFFTHASVNYKYGGKFWFSQSSHVFLMGRISENGLLKKVLTDEENQGRIYNLTQYKDELPPRAETFIWDSFSPIYKTDGWKDTAGEYKKILKIAFTSWKYLPKNILECAKGSVKQFFSINNGHGIGEYPEGTPPYEMIKKYFPREFNEFRACNQQRNKIHFDLENYLQKIWMIGFLIFLFTIRVLPNLYSIPRQLKLLFYLVTLSLACNAFVCGTFVNVVDRLQGRIFWLIPLIFLLMFYQVFSRKIDKFLLTNKD